MRNRTSQRRYHVPVSDWISMSSSSRLMVLMWVTCGVAERGMVWGYWEAPALSKAPRRDPPPPRASVSPSVKAGLTPSGRRFSQRWEFAAPCSLRTPPPGCQVPGGSALGWGGPYREDPLGVALGPHVGVVDLLQHHPSLVMLAILQGRAQAHPRTNPAPVPPPTWGPCLGPATHLGVPV